MDKFALDSNCQETQKTQNEHETLPLIDQAHSPQNQVSGLKGGMMSTIASGLRHSMQMPTGSMRRDQGELDLMKKQMRAEKAEFTKKMAILEQQNEILTLQLAEAQKREKIQQEMSDRVIQVLRDQIADAQNQNTYKEEITIEQDNPKVQQLVAIRLQSMQERLHKQQEDSQHQLYNKGKELQKSQFDVQNLQRELEACKRESEQKARHFEQKIRSIEHEQNSTLLDLKQQHLERTRELEHAVDVLTQEQKKDQEQLINNQREQTQVLNSKYATLQRQHQDTLTQLKQALVEIEGLTDQNNQLAKDLESNQQDVVDLENAMQEMQIQHQTHEQAARVEQQQLHEEITRLEQANSLQKSLVKERSGNRTSTTLLSLNIRDRKTSSSTRCKTNIAKANDDSSYMRFSREDFSVLPSEIGHEGDDDDYMNKCSRLVSHYRSLSKRLEVQLKDLKDRYKKDVGKLQNMIQTEKKRRTQLFEDKIDRTSQLMKELVEKDNQIIALQAQLSSVRSYYVEKKYNVPQDEETPPLVSVKKMIQSRANNKAKLDIPTKTIDVQRKKEEQSPCDNFDTQEGSELSQIVGYTFVTNRNSKVGKNASEVVPVAKLKQDFQSIIQTPLKIVVQDDDQSVQSSAQRSPRNEYYQLSRNLNQPHEYQDEKKSIDVLENSIVSIALLHNQMSNSSSFEVTKDAQIFDDSQVEPNSQLQTLNSNVAQPSIRTKTPLKGSKKTDLQSQNPKVETKKRPPLCSPNRAQKTVQTHMLFKTTIKSPSPTFSQAPKKLVLPFRSTSTSRSTSTIKSKKQT